MKISQSVAVLALAGTIMCSTSMAAAGELQTGDTLVYAVTLELQQHRVQQAPLPEQSTAASGQGSEVMHVYSIGADGSAYAKVDASFQGVQDGKPVALHGSFFAKILPDGQIRFQGGLDCSIDEALNFANTITREIALHSLAVGQTWKTVLDTPYVSLTVTRRVTGRKQYQRFPAVVIESTANGTLKKSSDGKKALGAVTISGSSYYDDRERLLIGESIRMLTVIQAVDQPQAHINYSATVNVVLSSLTHAPQPVTPAAPSPGAAPQPSTSPSPSPAPTGSPAAPGATPTVTPRAGY